MPDYTTKDDGPLKGRREGRVMASIAQRAPKLSAAQTRLLHFLVNARPQKPERNCPTAAKLVALGLAYWVKQTAKYGTYWWELHATPAALADLPHRSDKCECDNTHKANGTVCGLCEYGAVVAKAEGRV